MATRTSRVAFATCLLGFAVAACSGRIETRTSQFDPNGGNGGDTGGQGPSIGGSGSRRPGGAAGYAAGPSQGGRTSPGGTPGNPGGGPSRGGGVGVAGSPTGGCSAPSCGGCTDCLSSCVCYGNDKQFCYDACVGGTGGSAGAPGCNPAACPVQGPFSSSVAATGCCLPDGSCGVQIDQFAGMLGVEGGCQPYGQVGWPTSQSQCPVQGVLSGSPVPPCCRYDATCGLTLDFVNLGCVRSVGPSTAPSGGSRYCNPAVGVGGGGPIGAGGAIGFPSGGGFPGSGGRVNTGGQPAAGGSRTVDQCVAGAQSDCERCVCKSCNTSLDGCFQDAGCPLILQCANQTGCTGIDCYGPNTCQSVIDEFGGLGSPSVNLAIPLFGCAQNCPCGFGP